MDCWFVLVVHWVSGHGVTKRQIQSNAIGVFAAVHTEIHLSLSILKQAAECGLIPLARIGFHQNQIWGGSLNTNECAWVQNIPKNTMIRLSLQL